MLKTRILMSTAAMGLVLSLGAGLATAATDMAAAPAATAPAE